MEKWIDNKFLFKFPVFQYFKCIYGANAEAGSIL